MLVALLRDDITVAIESYAALRSAIDDGQIRAVASSGTARTLSNVPTSREAGMPGFEVVGWNALFAPAGTPEGVLSRLRGALATALSQPEVRDSFNAVGGMEPYATKLEDFTALIRRDHERFGKLIRNVHISID